MKKWQFIHCLLFWNASFCLTSIWLYFKNILMLNSLKWIKSKWLLLPEYLHAVGLLLLLKWKMWVLLNSQTATLTLCCHIAAMKALLIPFHVHFLAFISVFVSTPVIKVQIVLPRLLSHHMAWWEIGVFLKALIFEVIVPPRLQGAAQVLLFFFHFPDMFRISGKLPPAPLTAICLAWLRGSPLALCSLKRRLCFGVECAERVQRYGWLFDGLSCYSFVIAGLMKELWHWSPIKHRACGVTCKEPHTTKG